MPLTEKLIILSMLALAVIPFVLVFRLRAARVKAYKEGGVSMADAAIDQSVWPLPVRQLQNSYNNQFEMPVLFYALCFLAFYTGASGWVTVALCWGYVALRWAHMVVHTGSNHVPTRMRVFAVSVLMLIIFVLYIAIRTAIFV